LELPVGGKFQVEMAEHIHFTTLDHRGQLGNFGDGKNHPQDYSTTNLDGEPLSSSGCLYTPNLWVNSLFFFSSRSTFVLLILFVSLIDILQTNPTLPVLLSPSPILRI
jgi:hypothetical protein